MKDNNYEMYVDTYELQNISDRLQRIKQNLNRSECNMVATMRHSQETLGGVQFEKTKNVVTDCIQMTQQTEQNIDNIQKYLKELRRVIEDYGKCAYVECGE